MSIEKVVGASAQIEASLTSRVNLAFHQNAVPLLRELVVVNDGDVALTEIELELSSEPAFFQARKWRLDSLGVGQRYHISDLDVSLDAGLLARLTEAEAANAIFTLKAGAEEISRLVKPIELLPRNHWSGIGQVPEMVAAFVQPNDPAVDRILKKAADILRENGREAGLNGYAGGLKRAWELASSIWSAIGAQGIDYALPPASFEHAGQKVRGAAQILEVRLATCLDTTLLFCACLEQCGLNPVVVFTQSHAFAGVWLKAEEFTTAVVDDVSALRKRVQLKEMALFETTLVTHRPLPAFSSAVERGTQQIMVEDDSFELVVDIRRARMQRIKPLSSGDAVASVATVPEVELEPQFEAAPDLPEEDIITPEEIPTTPQGRLDRWQRKLLDLSLRNSLLNFHATKRVVPLDAPDPGRLEDLIAQGKRIRLLPRPDMMEGTDSRNETLYKERYNEDARRAHALDALTREQVLVGLSQAELEARLVELYRQARANLQEGGANTLFLAFGFLVWKRTKAEERGYKAPLILLPVTLERKSIRSGFSLLLHEDEPRFNPTLLEMLRQDFKLNLPFGDAELPKDGHGLDITGIWRQVANSIKDIPGWEVKEEVALATFSFAKFLMWKDLVDRTDQLKKNPVVRHLIDTPREPFPSTMGFVDPHTLDRELEPDQIFCPLPADSSQLSAVMTAARGKDFVLIGPPGTGKSQTIANLIAQCLAERKTVLFVSEKIAALDVVYRRLRGVGLGDFCLELHSNKARKLDVLEQLRQAWDAKGAVDAEEWRREARRLKALRDELNTYVERLHRKHRNGLTAFAAIGRILGGENIPRLGLSWPSAESHDADGYRDLCDLADRMDVSAQAVGAITDTPLAVIAHSEWSPHWRDTLIQAAQAVPVAAESLKTTASEFLRLTGLPDPGLAQRSREGLKVLAELLPRAAGRDWRFMLKPDANSIAVSLRGGLDLLARHRVLMEQLSIPWPADVASAVRKGIDLLKHHREITSQLSVPYADGVKTLDVERLKADWDRAERSWFLPKVLGQKKVTKALAAFVPAGRKPDVSTDLERLVALRHTEAELGSLEVLIARTGKPWTTTAEMEAALRFQSALEAARDSQPWTEEGLSAIADGHCGADMKDNLLRMRDLRALEGEINALTDLGSRTAGLWAGLRTNVAEVEAALSFHSSLTSAISLIAGTAEDLAAIKGPLERLLGDGNMLLDPKGPLAGAGRAYAAAQERFEAAVDKFCNACGQDPAAFVPVVGDNPRSLAEACRAIVPLAPKLNGWCAWRKVRAEAMAAGLSPLVGGIESGAVALGRVREVFEVEYARWWLDAVVENDAALREFVSAQHESRIQAFKVLDDHFNQLTRAIIRANLCAELPSREQISKNSGWALLNKEMQKKRAHIPLRSLIQGMRDALPKLTPCLLMSPLSIAQYLPPDQEMFDIVVFDEASQIPIWDAVGAIARGRQVVMVGDPRQLPPTNFFSRSEEDADDDVEVEGDMESILDECMGANLAVRTLDWHYRSRHESLIAFSNHRYYESRLVTFPSPVTEDRAVSFHLVRDGVYEKGGARINKPEAFALVRHLIGRLKDPEFSSRGLTVGVVTFNSEQQKLIEDLLDEERRKDPSLESHFAENALEPIFVKNLENVQGDERDVMYFSITYGPDMTGAVSMNFGPMNKSGGERRLNVAITRARYALHVFSSLSPDMMDLSRTKAEGVRDLKHFLEFAERGPRALAEVNYSSVGDYDSPFEKAVAIALSERGWQVHPQVGVSRFRIDLGVVDPDAPGRYLAGIECDGATYHRAATARDRDKLREQVLRGLGWEIIRIWSTDWWVDKAGALDKVHDRLMALLGAARSRRAAEEARAVVPVVTDAAPEMAR
jgi:Superfamily I DNA and RNA helicases and helicase subunits